MASMVQTRSMSVLSARHPEAHQYFQRGISAIFRMWTALELALFHQWGGQQGGEAAEDLQQELIQMFLQPERIYKDDVAIVIEDYMDRHFNTILEDGSPDELGELLCNMWRQCCEGNFTLVADVQAKQLARTSMVGASQGLAGGDAMDESDDEVDHEQQSRLLDDGEAAHQDALSAANSGGIYVIQETEDGRGNGDSMDQEEEPPLVDEEGFETVLSGKNKKKKNKKY